MTIDIFLPLHPRLKLLLMPHRLAAERPHIIWLVRRPLLWELSCRFDPGLSGLRLSTAASMSWQHRNLPSMRQQLAANGVMRVHTVLYAAGKVAVRACIMTRKAAASEAPWCNLGCCSATMHRAKLGVNQPNCLYCSVESC